MQKIQLVPEIQQFEFEQFLPFQTVFKQLMNMLEMAGHIVAKCDQTLVWAIKFMPIDRPENKFGQPNLKRHVLCGGV